MDSPSSDAASVPPPRDSPDPSAAPQTPERVAGVQTAIVLRSEEYRQLFRLPTEEVLVEDFNCAYQENIPVQWQGHMYLFAHHICFYSYIFGFETKKIIHFREITSVKRAKTAGIFPNAIEIYAGAKKYFFASFLSRDQAFNLISNGWLNHSDISNEITDKQALTPLSSFTENGSESDSAINLTNDDDVETTERHTDAPVVTSEFRHTDAPVCMDSPSAPDPEDGNLSALEQKTDDNGGSSDSGLQPTAPSPSAQKAWSWKVEDVDAGRIPEDLTKVAESKFPITVEEFFNLFFSDDSFNFVESFHKRCGDKDFKCSSWKQHDHFGHTRNVSFQHPIKLYLGARHGSCQILQKFRVFRNSLVFLTSQEISDIPFADYFRVEGLWDVRRDGDGSCCLSVYIGVTFVKKTMFKGKIVQSTLEECREAYASWIEMAHDLLREKNIEKQEDVSLDRSTTPIGSTCSQDAGNNGPSETLPPTILGSDVAKKNSSSTTLDQHDSWPSLQSLVNPETVVLIQNRTEKLWSKLRSQIHVPLFVAVLFTIVLLIQQLSIIVLLSRLPSVQIISPEENVNMVDDTSTETMTWLEKRLYYLKEEVSLVEARFERMQWEYSRIKHQLGEL